MLTFKNNTYRNLTLISIIATVLITSGIGVAYAIIFNEDVIVNGNIQLGAISTETYSSTLAFGQNTNGDAVIWIPDFGDADLHFKSTTTGNSGDRIVFTSEGDVGIGISAPTASLQVIGNATFGESSNIASGTYSAAFGDRTTASGQSSFAAGQQTNAIGSRSMAFGHLTTASNDDSTAFGESTIASGTESTAFGLLTLANGTASVAFGQGTVTQSYSSFVLGACNEDISGDPLNWVALEPLFVIGNGTPDSQPPYDCISYNNAVTILKNGNVGIGISNPSQPLVVAGIINSTSGGYVFPDGTTQTTAATDIWTQTTNNISYTTGNVGIGESTPTHPLDVIGSVSFGDSSNDASGTNSAAFGAQTIASNLRSVAFGFQSTASEENTAAFGFSTLASGANTAAFGDDTTAQAFDSFVIGRHNIISGTPISWVANEPLFVIGNGADAANLANAVTVLKNGNVGIGVVVPTELLQVAGTIESTTNGFKFPDGTLQTTASTGGAWTESVNDISYNLGNVGIGTTNPTNLLSIADATIPKLSITDTTNDVTLVLSTGDRAASIGLTTNNDLNIKTNDIVRIKVEKNGNVGIGINNPNSLLEVEGGYIELDVSDGLPPNKHCNNASEVGRMIVDDSSPLMYVCTSFGWATFTGTTP